MSHVMLLPLRVNQNLLVLFLFLLVVAECFYARRNLPDFGYGKLKCLFAII